ncbi:MAG: hypothetical protein H7210_11585, partial [Pyrinomonadaceae bacterium]|nr:hypothetical protein [Phycisphaerales bacterium]
GCGEQIADNGGRQTERAVKGSRETDVDPDAASYYREQARQIFGADVIRVEPLPGQRGEVMADGSQRRMLDTLPSRTRDPNADILMAQAALKKSANANSAWVEPDRPERQDRRTLAMAPPPAPAPTPPQEMLERRKVETSSSLTGRDPPSSARSPSGSNEQIARQTPESPAVRPDAGHAAPRAAAVAIDAAPAAAAPATGHRFWSIVLVVFRGEGSENGARIALGRIQKEGGLPEAYMQRMGPAWAVVFGKYSGPDDASGQADLKRIQAAEVNGVRLYAGTYLCPPPEGNAPIRGEFDLRNARAVHGKDAIYTLQVGVYSREDVTKLTAADVATIRKAAEDAAIKLRQEGELAFFYHGVNRSQVLVGAFELEDFDPKTGRESPRLREAKIRHPYNLYNGAGYTAKVPGMTKSKLVPSGLVAIPKR